MRLQKYLAQCGVASRRKCEAYILEGRITINGQVVTELGTQVKVGDLVTCDNRLVSDEQKYVYYLLNKPMGYVTTVQDEKGRPTVMDIMAEVKERIFPVGRLDYNTSGLLVMTNDGELTYALTHPKHEVDKTYKVRVLGAVSEKNIERLQIGVMIDGKVTAPAKVKVLNRSKECTEMTLTIHEGRNRQVRKMCECIGHPVSKLTRIAIGEITLDKLPRGKYRPLTLDEIAYLRRVGGLDAE
ncbi:pseudouridine synthase [Sporanaerobium hydrogeniformans]|uniref:Pseudouridine synthase n=1 Tax=Sporanaerobium hydrogeniformans TaxID=3072179 RepID=A0AC61DE34_9FIRM|nr:pseudouridine synthase [Sporanaerobium hydrogeniformans]PHV71157.1 pseudouridine synthase [Sporanaerobium hydrogeniformans]